ncbi:MAG: ferritin-like domain-containing protein [Polyangiaceae bacterium]
MNALRPMTCRLAAQILQSIAAAACAGVVIHAAGCGTDVEGDGSAGPSSSPGSGGAGGTGSVSSSVSSSISNSGGNWMPKEGVQCIPWPPGGEGGAGGTAGSTVGSAGGAGACPPPSYLIDNGYMYAYAFCGGCCAEYQSVDGGTMQDGECCYEVVANCTSGSGRPLLVDGRPLTTSARRGATNAWNAPPRPSLAGLSAAQRNALASAWLGDALLEHASVASFSRFAIELMAVGAPADLLDDAHSAARDEVKHARLCFALAGAYAGHALEPEAMASLRGLVISTDLADVAARAVAEGCVGETLAALWAAEQLEAATDAAVRDVLAQIAEDEARHAALAWRFVAWAVRTGGEAVHAAVARSFAEAIAAIEVDAVEPVDADPSLSGHGRLGQASLRAVARAAITAVIQPAMDALVHAGRGCGDARASAH